MKTVEEGSVSPALVRRFRFSDDVHALYDIVQFHSSFGYKDQVTHHEKDSIL
jgi:hypothetical protein